MRQIPSLTISIPAYNEAATIWSVIDSLLSQNQCGFTLACINIYTDGCTDKTEKIVSNVAKKHSAVHLIKSRVRRGKVFRLNQIFSGCRTDLLLVLDADIAIESRNFISRLVINFLKDPQAAMLAAHQEPFCPSGLTGHLIYSVFVLWDCIRTSIPNYNSVHNFYGAATLYRSSFVKNLRIPAGFTEERTYLYLKADAVNGFRYCSEARIYYWPPGTFNEYAAIGRRSFGKHFPQLKKEFGSSVNRLYNIPLSYKILGILKSFYRQPLWTPLALVTAKVFDKYAGRQKFVDTPYWEIAASSKKPLLINY